VLFSLEYLSRFESQISSTFRYAAYEVLDFSYTWTDIRAYYTYAIYQSFFTSLTVDSSIYTVINTEEIYLEIYAVISNDLSPWKTQIYRIFKDHFSWINKGGFYVSLDYFLPPGSEQTVMTIFFYLGLSYCASVS
jgi:hypothetical protein